MGKTSNEVKQRWIDKAYSRYLVSFRYDTDGDLIDFMEKNKERLGTTNIFRDALQMYINANKDEA